MSEKKLNIGAAITFIPGFINIDISSKADISLDLNTNELPFESNSIDLIFSYHTYEHISNYIFALGEVHRVLKHGGRFLLGVPYLTSTELNLVNPYHRQFFTERSFDFFDPAKNKGGAGEENPILFQKVFHHFHYIGIFHLIPPPLQTWARRHLFNVVHKIDFGLLAIKDINHSIPITPQIRTNMHCEYQNCLRFRVPYENSKHYRIEGSNTLHDKLRNWKLWWNGLDQ